MLAIGMVLSFVMPLFQSVSFADSEEDYYVPPAAESSDDYYIPSASKSSETFFDTTPELSPDDYYTPPVGQSVGTYFTVKDQYGRAVNNVYFTLKSKTYSTVYYYGKAENGTLLLYVGGKYQKVSLENAGFYQGNYDVVASNQLGDVENYDINPNASLLQFSITNGGVTSNSTNIVLQSKEAPPTPPPTDAVSMTAKDAKNSPAEGIAFRLYKEGEANIQGYFISNSAGNLVYSANGELFDAAALDEGTYTLKATPQVSTDAAKGKYSIDSTKIYTTITVTADGDGKKSVAFSPEDSQNLVFPLIENIPKGEAKLTVNKVDENGNPLKGATFQLAGPVDSDDAGSRTSTETDAKGKTVFSNLAYGEYILKEVSAPKGYVVSKKEIHVLLGKDSDVPYVGGKDVTDRLTLDSVTWNPPHVENGVNTIYPNQAESLTVDSVIKVPTDGEAIVPGDTFTVQLSDNVDTYGLVRSAEQGLDIFANGGKLAEGKFDPETRTITYTFTNLMKTFKANQIKLHTVLFIDKVVVQQETAKVTLTYGLKDGTPSSSNFQVFYLPYYYPQRTRGSNIGTMYSIYNPDKKTATTYIYVNPLHNSLKKSKLEIMGKGSVLVNDLTDVKVYDGGSGDPNTMVPSWGLVPDNLTPVTDFKPQIDGNRGKITIDLGDSLKSRDKAYIVKVTTGYDPSSTDDLGMVAKLYGYYNGYYSWYNNYSYYDYDWAAAQTYMKFYEHEATATGVEFNASVKVSNAKNSIEWTKVNESGIPLEGAAFKLVRVDGANETAVKTGLRSDRDGHLSVSGLAPGLYKLYETKAPEGYEKPIDKDGKLKPMSVFSVNEDGEITKMDPADGKLVNGRGEGRFSIHKTDNAENEKDRKPLKGAEFTLTPLKEDGKPDATKAVVKITDENGDLTFSGLPLGKYQLKETKPAPGYLLPDTTWTVVVEEKVLDPNHPDIKGVVTTVREDEPGAKEAPMAQSRGTENATPLRARGPAGLPSSPLSKLTARFAKTAAPASAMPLRSAGGGKYQYYNPQEVDQSKWPKNVQEVDADGDGKADYKITQTMAPDGTTPGQYKVNVKVEKMPETMELVILMDNASAFAQATGNKVDRFQWGGQVGGTLQIVPTAFQWLDYYFGGNRAGEGTKRGRITDLLRTVQETYPNAKVTLIGAGGAKSTVQYWVTNPYTGESINKAIQMNRQLNASGVYNSNARDPKWEFAGGWGRMGLKEAMQKSYETLNKSTAKKKVFFHLQGVPTFSTDAFTAPYLEWWDTEEPNDARSTFAKIKNIAQVNWLVELDPSDYDDDTFFRPQEYLDNGLPDPSKIHFLQKTSRFWLDKDQYWNQVDKQAMEAAYDRAMDEIAKNITTGSGSSDTLDLRIRLADNVLWREPSDRSMTAAGVSYDEATGSLTKSDFTMTSDKFLEFSYYVKANSQASTAKFNVFENINDAETTGLKVSWKNPDGTKADKTSAMPIPQLRIPGWKTEVTKYWYGNTATDDTRFNSFPETGTNPPTAPAKALAESKRKPSQVLVYSDTAYSDDKETKIGVGQRMESPYEALSFKKLLPYYDNDGNEIAYKATEYHDALFKTKTNLIQDDDSLKQTFYIGAQMEPEDIRTDVVATVQWGAGTKPEDQVPVKVKLLAYRLNGDGTQVPIEGDELQNLVGEGKPTELTVGGPGWKGSFKDLPTSQIDQSTGEATEIVYRVKEEPLPGFDVSYLYDYEEKAQLDGTKKPTHYYTIVNQKHELLKVTNAPNEVDFYKVDDKGNPLSGAKFTLQKKHVEEDNPTAGVTPGDETTLGGTEDGTKPKEQWVDVRDSYTNQSTETVKEKVEITEPESGTKEIEIERQKIHFEKLEPGEYRLMEVTTPKGYRKITTPVATFTVSEKTGEVQDLKVMDKEGKLVAFMVKDKDGNSVPGKSGADIYNLPNLVFYVNKLGKKADGTEARVEKGKLILRLTSVPFDEVKNEYTDTFTFDLSKDYEKIGETGETGLKIIIPSDWPAGTYELTEDMAPMGYRALDAPIRLRYTIPADSAKEGRMVEEVDEKDPLNVLATLYEEEKIDDVWTPKYGTNYKPYNIVNEHSVFPEAAGPGTVLFAVAGAFLMTMAIALGGLTRKREKL